MNILIITGSTDPTSGIGRSSKEIIEKLIDCGENVLVASESGKRDITLLPRTGWKSMIKNIWTVRMATRNMDIVHALDAWPFSIYGFFAVLGTKICMYMNGIGTYSVPPKGISLKRILMLIAYKKASHVFCISAYTQKRIRENLPFVCSMSIVYLATTQLPKPNTSIISNLYNRYHIAPSARIVLTVGAIKDRKGQLDTLRGVIKARSTQPLLMYIMIGSSADTTYINKIKEEAKKYGAEDLYRIIDNVSSDDELAAWYSIADVFALTSNTEGNHFEGFGLVFLEAGFFGVPGIGTTECGIEDAIVDNETGLLVASHDTKAISAALLKILKSRKFFSQNVYKFASKFSWRKTVEEYRKIYSTKD